MNPPDAVLKRLAAKDSACKLGVILRGQFYVYKVDGFRVHELNTQLSQNFKVGTSDLLIPHKLCSW